MTRMEVHADLFIHYLKCFEIAAASEHVAAVLIYIIHNDIILSFIEFEYTHTLHRILCLLYITILQYIITGKPVGYGEFDGWVIGFGFKEQVILFVFVYNITIDAGAVAGAEEKLPGFCFQCSKCSIGISVINFVG